MVKIEITEDFSDSKSWDEIDGRVFRSRNPMCVSDRCVKALLWVGNEKGSDSMSLIYIDKTIPLNHITLESFDDVSERIIYNDIKINYISKKDFDDYMFFMSNI